MPMWTERYLGKYPPPVCPLGAPAPAGMGVCSFALIPEGLQGGVFDASAVFSLLDARDEKLVLDLRAFVAEWMGQERAMNAPFVDMARESKA